MQIYYFTRTGRSKQIAEELAAKQNVTALEIKDGKKWSGKFGYFKAGMFSSMGRSLPAVYEKPVGDERIAVVFPIWASNFPPAVKTFVKEVGRGNIVAVPTSLGSTLKDREGFFKIIDLVGKEIAAPKELL